MSVRFYMDEHVQGAITIALRTRGIDVLSVQEDGRAGAPDDEVLDRAIELQRVLFTRDADFLREAAMRQRVQAHFNGVVYAHLLEVPIGKCIQDLELIALATEPSDHDNLVQHLPL